MQNETNPLLCSPEKGLCEIQGISPDTISQNIVQDGAKPIRLVYFTDPICSSCWGIEPQLRRLKLEYGTYLEIEYRMGGLLPDWSYNSGGISKPSDVAHHWDEVSLYYDMPIDGDLWLEDPLHSSYPPSIAFKAAQMQDKEKAIIFLREIREMVFLKKKNITKWEHLEHAAQLAGLDIHKFKSDYEGTATQHFEEDLKYGRELGIRGFPTMIFTNPDGNSERVYGSKPYEIYEQAILKLAPDSNRQVFDQNILPLFSNFKSLTAKELSVIAGLERKKAEEMLDGLSAQGILQKHKTKNGSIWSVKSK